MENDEDQFYKADYTFDEKMLNSWVYKFMLKC